MPRQLSEGPMKSAKTLAELPANESNLAHICEGLRPLAVPCDSLVIDPANPRLHPEPNLEALKGSLAVYGQQPDIPTRSLQRRWVACVSCGKPCYSSKDSPKCKACYAGSDEPKYVAVTLERLADMGLKPELG